MDLQQDALNKGITEALLRVMETSKAVALAEPGGTRESAETVHRAAVNMAGTPLLTYGGRESYQIPDQTIQKAITLGQALARFENNLKLSLIPGFDQIYPTAWDMLQASWADIAGSAHMWR